jgi:hypothetical protein
MTEIHVSDRALCVIIRRLGTSATLGRIAAEAEPKSGWYIGVELATRRVRELRRAHLIRFHKTDHFDHVGWYELTPRGAALANAPPSDAELSPLARMQLRDLRSAGAPADVIRELVYGDEP